MPNIEIHGFGQSWKSGKVYKAIKTALEGEPYAEDVVITRCGDLVSDLAGKERPFIRICASEHEEEVLAAFQRAGINMDIEIQPLKRFIPAKK